MTLTNFPYNPTLDLAPWVGQRQSTFRFDLTDRVSGIKLGEITPVRTAGLSHDTGRTVKRQLQLALGVQDTADINPITDMVSPFMVFPGGIQYPLGEYVFTGASYQLFTSGELSSMTLNDQMFIIDQQLEKGFSTQTQISQIGISVNTFPSFVSTAVAKLLRDQPIRFEIEQSPFIVSSSWSAGTTRGGILEALSLNGDYFSPWFDNNGILQFIRAFNPATKIPDFDWDTGNQVLRSSILRSTNVLTAPNRFVVVSNSSESIGAVATFGSADVPQNAPHSIQNRGFVIPSVVDVQALTSVQCTAIASNLVQRQTVFETATLTTAPDPRHDSYNVIEWLGDLWLELAWDMDLLEGAPMSHTIRKAYR
jgi:hypothetical protein